MDVNQCSVCGKSIENGSPHVTAVVPFYKSEEHVPFVLQYVQELNEKVPGGVNAVFVIDGSPDKAEENLRSSIDSVPYPVSVVSLSRNFGVGPALHAAFSDEDNLCVSMVFGSDLQEPNDLFIKFADAILNGDCAVALGQRKSREDPVGMRVTSAIYWFLYRKLISNDTPKGGYDVFGVSRPARAALTSLSEKNTNITAQIQWIGFDRKYFSFERSARISGKSTWTFRKRFGLFVDTFLGFSDKLLLPLYYVAITLFVLGTGIAVLTGLGISLSNQVKDISLGILVFGQGFAVLSTAIVGSVVFRTFENSKNRPTYIVQRKFKNSKDLANQGGK